jgi:3-dehydrosphinganine reductase
MTTNKQLFRNKSALVTGGSSGIGLATGCLLASQGAHVWLMARNTDRLKVAVKSLEAARVDPAQRFGFSALDVSDETQVSKAVKQVIQEFGVPDVLINSAGITYPGYVQDLSLEIFRQMMDTDYFGTVNLVQAFLPEMIKRRSGHIVNISSVAGFMGVFGYSAYGAAKYAVRGYSEVLRAELKPYNIAVSVVFPPDTDTPQLAYENGFKPMETRELAGNAPVMSPEKVAETILKGIIRKRFAILPGSESKLYYRLTGWLGGGLYPIMDMMIAQAQKKKEKSQSQNESSAHLKHD